MRFCINQVGLYYAWLGLYTQSLIFPSIAGLLIFLWNWTTVEPMDEIYDFFCDAPDNATMFCRDCASSVSCHSTFEVVNVLFWTNIFYWAYWTIFVNDLSAWYTCRHTFYLHDSEICPLTRIYYVHKKYKKKIQTVTFSGVPIHQAFNIVQAGRYQCRFW